VPVELREHEAEVIRRDREEVERLAYVAVTRARDLLVVPVVGDEERKGWLEALAPVAFPPDATKRAPTIAPACPPFGTDSVVARSRDCAKMPTDSVAPGLHVPRAGTHRVVWWDPHALVLDREIGGGIRQQQILAADESKQVATAGERAHAAWQVRRNSALAIGAAPSLVVRSVTDAARSIATPQRSALLRGPAKPDLSITTTGAPVKLAETGIDRVKRPSGKRFGSLVHAILAAVDLRGDAAHVRATAGYHARLVDASDDERDAAIAAVRAALAHPLLVRAAAATALRREVPIVLATPDGLVEGIVDLAFADAEGWTVVDFKTDTKLDAELRTVYEAQVQLYAAAITAATGRAASATLLLV
jgi:ATP-dependent exoDNAse (exonuclease V) beta subunit